MENNKQYKLYSSKINYGSVESFLDNSLEDILSVEKEWDEITKFNSDLYREFSTKADQNVADMREIFSP